MKTLKELNKQRDAASIKISALESASKDLQAAIMKYVEDRHNNDKSEEHYQNYLKSKGLRADIDIQLSHAKTVLKVIDNNIRIVIYNDLMPVAYELLKKYENKQAGEKTRKAFQDEVKRLTGFTISIKNYYINVYSNKPYNYVPIIEIGTRYGGGCQREAFINNYNQFCIVPPDRTFIYNSDYIDNPVKFVKDQQKTLKAAGQKAAELNALIEKINCGIDGIKRYNLQDFSYNPQAMIYGEK